MDIHRPAAARTPTSSSARASVHMRVPPLQAMYRCRWTQTYPGARPLPSAGSLALPPLPPPTLGLPMRSSQYSPRKLTLG